MSDGNPHHCNNLTLNPSPLTSRIRRSPSELVDLAPNSTGPILQSEHFGGRLGNYGDPGAGTGSTSMDKQRAPSAIIALISTDSAFKPRLNQRAGTSSEAPAIVRWISSDSERAPIFFMAVARWVSTVLWLMPRT